MKSFKNLSQDANDHWFKPKDTKKIFDSLQEDIKNIEEEIMNRKDKIDDEESPTENILNSILEKLLSIMNKVLTKVDEKLDDPKFMEKVIDVQKHERK